MRIDYDFTYNGDPLDAREIGVTLDLPRSYDELTWRRIGQWSVYPQDHIGRLSGSARAFRDESWPSIGVADEPPWPWSLDGTEAGTNDFRSGKRNILFAQLTDPAGRGIRFTSDGGQSARAWVDGDVVKLLAAEAIGPGSEWFLNAHNKPARLVINPGDRITGSVRLVPVK
jgi:hypothetical protein